MFQGLINHMVKVVTFCAIAKMVFSFIAIVFYGPIKQIPGFFYLISNFWKIDEPEWGTMFFYQMFHRNTMKGQVAISKVKSLLREVIALFY